MELNDQLEAVSDEHTFLESVQALQQDREAAAIAESATVPVYGINCSGWENVSIESFLEAALSWAEASNFGADQGISTNPWKKFAVFLYCGKIYE